MKVFISWSGYTGKAFAKILNDWLPNALHAVKPFFSPDDIVKGSRWNHEISKELDESQIGIIIVTKESLSSSWLMFEAGALSKNIGRSKVAPILFHIGPNQIQGPLLQFQCSEFNELDMKQLLRMLNSELKDSAVSDHILESSFSMWWPELKKLAEKITPAIEIKESVKKPTDSEKLEEILELTKSIAHHQSESRKTQQSEVPYNSSSQLTIWRVQTGAMTIESVKKRIKSGDDLIGANLLELNLEGMDLSNVNLQGANLCSSNLSGAKLVNANLEGANLEQANLDNADLTGAVISRTNLWRASMRNVKNLSLVKSMDDANFYRVHLNDEDRITVTSHKTISFGDYPSLFTYYFEKGTSKKELRDLFLWSAHTYPGIKI